jgi:hypothetical protein
MDIIKCHIVKCSFYPDNILYFKSWNSLCNFLSRNVGFDYTITASYEDIPDDAEYIDFDLWKVKLWCKTV